MVNWLLPVRAVQLLCAIICLGLSGYLVSGVSYSRWNFNLFTSLFTILIMVYLIGIQFVFKESSFAHPIFSIVLDGLAWVFWLASFAAIAAIVNAYNSFFGFDASPGVLNALLAFGVIEWLLFSVTLGFAIFAFLRGRGSKGAAPAQGV